MNKQKKLIQDLLATCRRDIRHRRVKIRFSPPSSLTLRNRIEELHRPEALAHKERGPRPEVNGRVLFTLN